MYQDSLTRDNILSRPALSLISYYWTMYRETHGQIRWSHTSFIVGRPLTHKPSSCPQSIVYRSLCNGGTRHYKHLYSKRDHWSRLERTQENGSLRVLQKSHKLFLSDDSTKRYNCPFLYHQLDLTLGKHSGLFRIPYFLM